MFKGFFRIDKSYWLIVPSVLYAAIPWFYFRVRLTYMFIPFGIWIILHLPAILQKFSNPRFRSGACSFLFLILCSFLNNLYAIFGHGDFSTWQSSTTALNQACFFMMAHYTIVGGKWKELRFLTILTLVGFCIAGVSAIRGLNVEGLEGARGFVGVRTADVLSNDRLDLLIAAASLGLGTYPFIYMMAWLGGPLVIAYSLIKNKKTRVFLLLSIIAAFACVKGGGLGTAMVVAFLSLGLAIVWLISRSRLALKVLGVISLSLFFCYGTIPTVFSPLALPLRLIAENMEVGSIQERIKQMSQLFSGDKNTYAFSRAKLQLLSVGTFLKHPFFGVGLYKGKVSAEQSISSKSLQADQLGGHSTILDGLATGGIVYMSFFFLHLYFLARYFSELAKHFYGRRWQACGTLFIVLFVFTSLVNPTFGVPVVFYYLFPGFGLLAALSKGMFPGPWMCQNRSNR